VARKKQLITFEGWDGKWWKRIKVGKAVYDAAMFALPFKVTLAVWAAEEVGGAIGKAVRKRGTHRRSR